MFILWKSDGCIVTSYAGIYTISILNFWQL